MLVVLGMRILTHETALIEPDWLFRVVQGADKEYLVENAEA